MAEPITPARDAELRKLAQDPNEALRRWARFTPDERNHVQWFMSMYYSIGFAVDFR
jgi:hypothetical protein